MMPKRGGGNRGRNFRSDHFEHDDRGGNVGNFDRRRVSFKSFKANPNKQRKKFNDKALKLLDDDIDMAGASQKGNFRGHFRGRGGRMNSPAPRPLNGPIRKFIPGVLPWYQITIPYGGKHDKIVIIKALLTHVAPDVFLPHCYKINGNAAIFYVDDVNMAEKLFYADRKIVMPDGFKLLVRVRNQAPSVNIDENLKEKMKLCMAKRYNPATKALDLTKFHSDPDLAEVFCALFRPMIMLAAIDIIAENIPEIEAINLNDNKLHGLDHMKVLPSKLRNLKILYLGDNKIPYLNSLDPLKDVPLLELYLKGNPLVNKFDDHDIYVSDVRKKFPKLIRLDGVDLPPAIGFDVSTDVQLPPRSQSFLVDPQGQDLVRQFLTQYFAIYDSNSRQELLDAYHENAMLSMVANYGWNDARNLPSHRLQQYIQNSRNLIRVTDRESRRRHLKIGRLPVVSFLSELPKTEHDLMGFCVDLTIFTPAMIVLTMNGVFKETAVNMTPKPHRSFHRTFLIVPSGSGFCIMNDALFVTNATRQQEETAFASSLPGGGAAAAPAPASAAAPGLAPAPSASAPDDAHKLHLVMQLAQQTGMNQHWSTNCLQETGWDMQRAVFIFTQLQSEGKIPPEAFVN